MVLGRWCWGRAWRGGIVGLSLMMGVWRASTSPIVCFNCVTKVTFATVRTHAEYNRSYQDDSMWAEKSEHAECKSDAASRLKKEEERVRFIVVCHVRRILIFYCCVIFVIRFYCVVIDEMFIEYCWRLLREECLTGKVFVKCKKSEEGIVMCDYLLQSTFRFSHKSLLLCW